MDLFKFYVEDLKARFHDEKKMIKEVLKVIVTYLSVLNVMQDSINGGCLVYRVYGLID